MGPPLTLGPFELLTPIAQGGMGEVWKAVHSQQNIPVAVKMIHGRISKDEAYIRDFSNEMRAIAGMNHPGVVWIYDYGSLDATVAEASGGRLVEGSAYLVMEYADEGTLSAVRGVLSWTEIRALLLALLDALGHAHARGVIHRDLKPDNVLLCGPNSLRPGIKLTDFGIAHIQETEALDHRKEQMMGTRHYCAPEQALCWWRDYGPWTDLYAVGCLVYTLATGRPPFAQYRGVDVLKAQVREMPPPFVPRMTVPDGFSDWVACLLKKWPYQRFQCAADAARALLALGAPDGSERDLVDPLFRGWYVGRGKSAEVLGHEASSQDAAMFEDSEATLVPESERVELELDTHLWRNTDDLSLRVVKQPLVRDWRRAVYDAPVRQLMGVGLGLYAHRTLPMIGREAERDRLWSLCLESVTQKRAGACVINGRAGEGKTRLGYWFMCRVHELGLARTLKITGREFADPMSAIQEMVESLLHLSGLDEAAGRERIERLLQPRGVQTDDIAAFYRTFRDGMRSGMQWAQLELLVALIEAYASERPIVLWVEDAHYNALSVRLVRSILRELRERAPVFCLVTARNDGFTHESDESATYSSFVEEEDIPVIELAPFSQQEQGQLVEELLSLDGDLAAQVVERTGGNPLFAVQLVGEWVRSGVLHLGANGFALRKGVAIDVPDQIHHVWRNRVESVLPMPKEVSRHLLECAAVLGQEFHEREWSMVASDPNNLAVSHAEVQQALIHRLMKEQLLVRTATGWAFTQAQFRECVLRIARESGRWVQQHLTCAFAIQEHVNTGADAERLGIHLLEAGVYYEALPALAEGIKHREATGALRRAIALLAEYEKALGPESSGRNDPRWDWMWGKRAHLMWLLGRRRESKYWLDKAIALADKNEWMVSLRAHMGLRVQWAIDDGDAPMARQTLEQLNATLSSDSSLAEWGEYFRLLGLNEWMLRRFESSLVSLGRARSCFGEVNLPRRGAWCLVPMAWVQLEWGEIATLEKSIDKMYTAFHAHKDERGLAYVSYFKSRMARGARSLDSSLASALEANARWLECSAREVTQGYVNVGCIRLRQSRFHLARTQFNAALTEAKQAQWRHMVCAAQVGLMASYAGLEEWGGFDSALSSVAQMMRGGRFLEWDTAWPIQLAGQLAEESGETARASRAYELSLRLWRFLGNEKHASDVLAAMAQLSSRTRSGS